MNSLYSAIFSKKILVTVGEDEAAFHSLITVTMIEKMF